MKRTLLVIFVALCSLMTWASDSDKFNNFHLSWDEISALVENHPDSVKALIGRVALGDSTLSVREVLVAYMGQSFYKRNPMSESMDARSAMKKGDTERAMKLIAEAVKANPLSLSNNYYYALFTLRNNPQIRINDENADKELKLASFRSKLLARAIFSIGNGKEDFPLKVTRVDDEYVMLDMMGLPRPEKQELTEESYDKLFLPLHDSKLFGGQEIYFDASRVMLLYD